MIDKEGQLANDRKMEEEFIRKLSLLVAEYRSDVHLGKIVGALEIVKMRLFHEASEATDEEFREKKKGGLEAL